MSDIKLFRIASGQCEQLESHSMTLEKSLQTLIESHLEALLGVRFIVSEYSTGKVHGGRIDTLGIDENGCPVIIEYKRQTNENVINQGLFYLDWLMDHKGEFELLVRKKLDSETAEAIEWSSPRLLCIAGDFTRYDSHAISQINRNIELIRYRSYPDGLLLFEQESVVEASQQPDSSPTPGNRSGSKPPSSYKTVSEYLEQANKQLKDLYKSLEDYLLSLGDDVTIKTTKFYIAFRRIKNFASIEVHPQSCELLIFVKVDPDSITLENGFTRDVRNIGHFGTGHLEIRLKNEDDLERAKPLINQSYETS
jgi:predicted transport protein